MVVPTFSEVAEYPNYQDFQGTKCRMKVNMLSVSTMYAASLVFKYHWKCDEDLMPKKLITMKWKMAKRTTFDVVLEELSYFQKTDKSDLLIQGIEFEPVEMASFSLCAD
ncbi:hypothetical protein Tco_0607649 [Tanacetum coccineum]